MKVLSDLFFAVVGLGALILLRVWLLRKIL